MSANTFGKINFLNNNNQITLQSAPALAASYTLQLPPAAPGNGQTLVWNTTAGAFEWQAQTNNTALNSTNSALTVTNNGSGSFTLAFASQTQRLAFLSPLNGSGVPLFRGIANEDLPQIDAGKINGTLSTAIMPSGTDASSWQLAVSGFGAKFVNAGTGILVQQNDGTPADLSVRNLTVQGTTTTINSETVTIDDNIFVLNNNFTTGTPTENAGFEVRRGGSASATLLWDETADRFTGGVIGSLQTIGYKLTRTFISSDLVNGVLTWAHNQNSRLFHYQVFNNSFQAIGCGATSIDANTLTIDLTALTITGTWTVVLFI